MYDAEEHEMLLATTHSSGEEEWFCPTCGRRFLMHWPPAYKKIILDPGDEYAIHSGSKGSMRMGGIDIYPANEPSTMDDLLSQSAFGTPMSEQAPSAGSWEADEIERTPITKELQPWLNWLRDADLNP